MKKSVFLLAVLALSPVAAHAKKPKPVRAVAPPHEYNLIGSIGVKLASYDATATVTSGADTAFVGCDVSGSTASCSDSAGVPIFMLSGHHYITGDIWTIEGPEVKYDGTNTVFNPPFAHLSSSWREAANKATNRREYNELLAKAMGTPESFKYRVAVHDDFPDDKWLFDGVTAPDIVICVPYGASSEACVKANNDDEYYALHGMK